MRIGIYNPRVGTKAAGGTETFLRQIMKRCEETIDLFTGEGELLKEVKDLDINIYQVPVRYKEDRLNKIISNNSPFLSAEIESASMFFNAKRTGVLDKMMNCDVISTHYYADNLLLSRYLDIPHIFRFAGIKGPSIRWKMMFTADDTDSYVANSASTADRLARWYGIDVDGIVYPGVDVDQFSPAEQEVNEEFVVLFVGRLDDGKGIKDLIEGVRGTEVFLKIVGEGNRRPYFEAIAHEKLGDDQYEFVGPVPHDEIQEEYRAADLFCLPSYHESFGIVVIEALACGLPTITTRIDAIEEYIDHGENGLLFEPGDTEELRTLVRKVKKSDKLRCRLSKNGRETSLKYSWDVQTKKMERIYDKVSRHCLAQRV